MSGPKVLCIGGSPRRGGNSEFLLDALAAGVSGAGGEPVKLMVADHDIAPCRGCGACSISGSCVVHDDMDVVYRALDSAEAVAISTPVYFATVPATLKALYDRCQPYWARRYLLGHAAPEHKRPGALIVVGGGGDPFGTGCVVTPTRSVFGVLGVSLDDVRDVIGPDARDDSRGDADAIAHARVMGERLVSRLVP